METFCRAALASFVICLPAVVSAQETTPPAHTEAMRPGMRPGQGGLMPQKLLNGIHLTPPRSNNCVHCASQSARQILSLAADPGQMRAIMDAIRAVLTLEQRPMFDANVAKFRAQGQAKGGRKQP